MTTYHVRLPYAPPDTPDRKGYYYFTIRDVPYAGHHDARINFPPRLLTGTAEEFPDLQRHKPKGPIILSYPPESRTRYRALDIEDRIWNTQRPNNVLPESLELWTQALTAHIGGLPKELDQHLATKRRGHRFGGPIPSTEELTPKYNHHYLTVLNTCRQTARAVSSEALLHIIDQQPNVQASEQDADKKIPLWQVRDDVLADEEWVTKQRQEGPVTAQIDRIRGLLTRRQIYPILTAQLGVFEQCGVIKAIPPAIGWMSLQATMSITPSGHIEGSSLKLSPSNAGYDEYLPCLRQGFQELEFPKPSDGSPVSVQIRYSVQLTGQKTPDASNDTLH